MSGFRDAWPWTEDRLRWVIAVFAGGVSVVGTSFALYGTSQSFVIVAASRGTLDLLPSDVVASIIWNFGDYSFALALIGLGTLLAVVTGAVSHAAFQFGRARSGDAAGLALSAVLVALLVALLVGAPLPALVPAVAGTGVMALIVRMLDGIDDEQSADRRRVLVRALVGVGAYNVVTHAIGAFRGVGSRPGDLDGEAVGDTDGADDSIDAKLATAADRSLDIDSMSGLVVDVEDFYTVDINPRPPTTETEGWSLSVTGAVETEREYDYAAIRDRESVDRFKTLRCLGDPVDGEQIGTALWSGCSISDLIAEANPQGSHAVLRAPDDYYYSMPLSMLADGLVAYGMNGRQLPRPHGYPVRALVPNRWGKLNVKWLDEIEIVEESESGYWEERGWNGMDTVNTVVKIEATNRLSDGRVQIGGHAYAGTRGVREVQVSVDGGETWETATLSGELPDTDTWRQWKYEWQPESSRYNLVAKAVDGTGTEQPRARSSPFPDGATGWAKLTLNVEL